MLIRVDHHPAKHDHFVVTPVLRFFYKTIWLEARIQQQQPRHGQLDHAILKKGKHYARSLLTLVILAGLSGSAFAETITTTVNGMVCAFCATGIEKTFRKQPEVATVKVDLHKKLVTIRTKPGKTLSDAKIKEVVTYSGYTMGKIVRLK